MADSTLPTDSADRKEYPLYRGLLMYAPAALAGASHHSKLGNDKHNPGEDLHHARGKSMDHPDCILRHMLDIGDLMAHAQRDRLSAQEREALLYEANALVWRAAMWSQQIHEDYGGAPMAPAARGD